MGGGLQCKTLNVQVISGFGKDVEGGKEKERERERNKERKRDRQRKRKEGKDKPNACEDEEIFNNSICSKLILDDSAGLSEVQVN